MLKVHTDRTVLLQFGERDGQVGRRLDAESMRELRKSFDSIRMNRHRGTWTSRLTTEVPNGEDDVLPVTEPQDNNDSAIIPCGVKERHPIKGRSANMVILDDVLEDTPIYAPLKLRHPTKRQTIDVGDYIQLDLI